MKNGILDSFVFRVQVDLGMVVWFTLSVTGGTAIIAKAIPFVLPFGATRAPIVFVEPRHLDFLNRANGISLVSVQALVLLALSQVEELHQGCSI